MEFGLIEPVEREGAKLLFDVSALPRLRLSSRLRVSLGINLAVIGVVLDLLDRYGRSGERMRRCRAGYEAAKRKRANQGGASYDTTADQDLRSRAEGYDGSGYRERAEAISAKSL